MDKKIIVITQEKIVSEEIPAIADMMESGCDRIHIRKPGAPVGEIKRYLDRLCGLVDRRKLSIHYYFDLAKEYELGGFHGTIIPEVFSGIRSCSCHKIAELRENSELMDYMFISPVFDSISKAGYKAGVDMVALGKFLATREGYKVTALGGISSENIGKLAGMGFNAAALLGSVWKDGVEKSTDNFKKIIKLWK